MSTAMALHAGDASAPLRTNWFHILLCLADGEQHGYAIMQEVRERTGRARSDCGRRRCTARCAA